MHIGTCDNLLQSAVKQLIRYCCYCGEMAMLGQFFLCALALCFVGADSGHAIFSVRL